MKRVWRVFGTAGSRCVLRTVGWINRLYAAHAFGFDRGRSGNAGP
jgi:hypothetical protein